MTDIEKTMLEAAAHIESKQPAKAPNKDELTSATKTLYIHWQYHPHDIDRTVLRRLYDETLKGYDGFDAMTVCYSRPKNLRDALTKTVLEQPENEKMSEIMNEMKNTNQKERVDSLVPCTHKREKTTHHQDENAKPEEEDV